MIKNNSIFVCVIFYDNYDEVNLFLSELNKQRNAIIHVAITINKDTNLQSDQLVKEWPTLNINLFKPESNIGYLNGLFFGYEGLLKLGHSSNWVIFCNTDIELPSDNFISSFLSKEYSDDIYCVAPSVFEKNRKVFENPQYKSRYSLGSLNRRIFIFSHPRVAKFYISLSQVKARIKRSRQKEVSCYVYSAHGSFFFLKNRFLKEIDRHYMSLMYSEEAYIAEEIRLKNKKIYYDEQLEVVHNESQSTGKLNIDKKSSYIADSLKEIRKKYFISGDIK